MVNPVLTQDQIGLLIKINNDSSMSFSYDFEEVLELINCGCVVAWGDDYDYGYYIANDCKDYVNRHDPQWWQEQRRERQSEIDRLEQAIKDVDTDTDNRLAVLEDRIRELMDGIGELHQKREPRKDFLRKLITQKTDDLKSWIEHNPEWFRDNDNA